MASENTQNAPDDDGVRRSARSRMRGRATSRQDDTGRVRFLRTPPVITAQVLDRIEQQQHRSAASEQMTETGGPDRGPVVEAGPPGLAPRRSSRIAARLGARALPDASGQSRVVSPVPMGTVPAPESLVSDTPTAVAEVAPMIQRGSDNSSLTTQDELSSRLASLSLASPYQYS
ncbi:hypothetical protein FISHEDRAFT_55033 [Fistulina hepatica ATCC 64428]|uniref:Uncharacterized protein n=1 Tax=Fistulina hepatica ATCC 64428 TaxID=1128425 RepID=A0A0D7AQ11_9AGAR|nr:hypothetical protein FISHEDRAFT_55033 [Fistulina hepatica ATCC 64428]